MLFQYKARKQSGALITGELEGETILQVKEALASQDLFPVSVQPKGFNISIRNLLQGGLKPKDLASFTRQFQVMFAAGMPMEKILLTLKAQTSHPGLSQAVAKIHADVSGGMRLRDAFARHPKYFNELYTNMLAVGEVSGVLDKTLQGISYILTKEHQIKAKIKSATLYPKIVFVVTILVAIVMLIFVVPTFSGFYAGHDAKLPLPTIILTKLSELIIAYWYLFLLMAGGIILSWKKFCATDRGKRFTAKMQLKMPVFGQLYQLAINARFGHLLSSLYRVGLPLARSLEVISTTIENVLYADGVRYLKQEVERGRSLSEVMRETKSFSPLVVECASVGEQTGKLDDLLESTATFYDEEADEILKNLTTLIEPIMLLFLFGMVTLLALAVYMPIWNLSKVVLPN